MGEGRGCRRVPSGASVLTLPHLRLCPEILGPIEIDSSGTNGWGTFSYDLRADALAILRRYGIDLPAPPPPVQRGGFGKSVFAANSVKGPATRDWPFPSVRMICQLADGAFERRGGRGGAPAAGIRNIHPWARSHRRRARDVASVFGRHGPSSGTERGQALQKAAVCPALGPGDRPTVNHRERAPAGRGGAQRGSFCLSLAIGTRGAHSRILRLGRRPRERRFRPPGKKIAGGPHWPPDSLGPVNGFAPGFGEGTGSPTTTPWISFSALGRLVDHRTDG